MTQLSDILLPSSIITTDNTKILTNKSISGADNTLTNVDGSSIINGTNISSLDASNISTGTVPAARLGSGTADATTYLRGDNTWQVVSGGGGSEWNYEGQFMNSHTTGGSADLLGHMTTSLSSYLSTYSSVKLNITLQSLYDAYAPIYPVLYYYKNNSSAYGKSFLELTYPTTGTGYYVRQQVYNSNFTYFYIYSMYNYVTIEVIFLGRHNTAFTDTPSAFQQCVANIVGNQTNINYGPIRLQSRFSPQTLNYVNFGNSFDDFRLLSQASGYNVRSTVEVYTK